jgi:hypothetical protein
MVSPIGFSTSTGTPGGDALKTAVHVLLIRRGQDDAVGPIGRHQVGEGTAQRHTELLGHLRRSRTGVDDRRQLRVPAGVDLLDVPPSDHSGARDGESDGAGHGQLAGRVSWWRPLIAIG